MVDKWNIYSFVILDVIKIYHVKCIAPFWSYSNLKDAIDFLTPCISKMVDYLLEQHMSYMYVISQYI